MGLSEYLKEQLRATPTLQAISEDACCAMIEALTLVPQVRPSRDAPRAPLDLRVLSAGKPKQRIGGPWAAGAMLNEWGTMALEQHADAARRWRDHAAAIAPRLPAGAMPVLARVMAFAAAFDPRTRHDQDPRDVGFVRALVEHLAALTGADDPTADIDAGIAARAAVFDWWFASRRLLELPDSPAPDGGPVEVAAFRAALFAALRRLTIAVPEELDARGGEGALHHLWLEFTPDSELRLTVIPQATLSEAERDAFRALHGTVFFPYAQDLLTDEGWADWQTIEAGRWPDADTELLADGGALSVGAARRLFEPAIASVSAVHLLES